MKTLIVNGNKFLVQPMKMSNINGHKSFTQVEDFSEPVIFLFNEPVIFLQIKDDTKIYVISPYKIIDGSLYHNEKLVTNDWELVYQEKKSLNSKGNVNENTDC
jgi:hypothetical protein